MSVSPWHKGKPILWPSPRRAEYFSEAVYEPYKAERKLDRGAASGGYKLAGDVLASGEVVQVEPMKSNLKAPGTNRMKLKHDVLLSSFGFTNFNLRRYTAGCVRGWTCTGTQLRAPPSTSTR
jgi:hypothetical protein